MFEILLFWHAHLLLWYLHCQIYTNPSLNGTLKHLVTLRQSDGLLSR